jgi:uncharacterized protein
MKIAAPMTGRHREANRCEEASTMPEKLKPSYYNFLFDLDDGTHLAFNAVTGAFVRIHEEDYEKTKALFSSPEDFVVNDESDRKLLEDAQRAKFIIDNGTDEFELLRFRHNLGKYSSERFYMTIMPTLECNFRCPYCYENPRKGKMSPEMQQALVRWVEEKLPGCRGMGVGWFGGEPLLAFDVIRNLTADFLALCQKRDILYSGSMTTNGFFLIPKIANRLEELSIKMLQVTLDGPPESHNVRRVLKNGRGSFQRIIDNLTYIGENYPGINIILRVNFDTQNYDSIPEVLGFIPDSLRLRSRIYFRQVYPPPQWWDKSTPTKTSAVPRDVGGLSFIHLEKEALDRGFLVLLSNYSPSAGYCEADYVNHFVIDPDCNLHKCTVAFDEEHRIGHITPEGKAEMNVPLLAKWMLRETMERENCRACRILPLCMGGCGFTTLCNKGRNVCSTINSENMAVENLKLLYRNKIIEESRKRQLNQPEPAEAAL